jgi:hypothetical protein
MLKRHERRGDECPRERGQHPGSRVWDLWAMASWVLATGWRTFAPAMAPVGNRRQGAPADVANPPWPPGQGSRLSPTVVFADGRYPLPVTRAGFTGPRLWGRSTTPPGSLGRIRPARCRRAGGLPLAVLPYGSRLVPLMAVCGPRLRDEDGQVAEVEVQLLMNRRRGRTACNVPNHVAAAQARDIWQTCR